MKYYLGIDLGGTEIAAGVVTEDYKFAARYAVPTGAARPFEEVAADMASAGRAAVEQAGISESEIGNVGIGVPSAVNQEDKTVVYANNLGWKNVDLISEFQKSWGIPVYMENDGDCALLAEHTAGAAKDCDNAVMLTLGTGVGGGLLINGRLFKGGDGFGTEPGLITIVAGGETCTGGDGSLEAYASASALIRDTIRAMEKYPDSVMREMCGGDTARINGRTAFDAAKKGDEAGSMVVREYIRFLAAGICSISVFLRPQVVVLGGGISNEGEYLLKPLREEVYKLVYASDIIGVPRIVKAAFGNDAGIIGAALLGK